MRNCRLILAWLALFISLAGVATARATEFDKVMLPIAPRDPVSGAFGSLWSIEFSALNRSDHSLLMYSWGPPCQILCPPDFDVRPVLPDVTFRPDLRQFVSSEVEGYFLWVEHTGNEDFHFNLRVRDLSRESATWGAEVPVVTESDVTDGTISLLDVPVVPGFRQLLRVYDYDATGAGQVVVRFYEGDPDITDPDLTSHDRLVAERVVPLRYAAEASDYPGYATLADFGTMPELAGVSRVRVDVSPVQPTFRIWAFVCVTHNETQHVTVISPE